MHEIKRLVFVHTSFSLTPPPPAVCSVSDGTLLASVSLPAYLSSSPAEDELTSFPFSSSASFCLLQVSADLSTAVAITQSHAAIAVDLNHYFRYKVSAMT